jgi:hypothetical protein
MDFKLPDDIEKLRIIIRKFVEEMNRSIFGPVCFNCAAPDDGNMYILNKIGTEDQKKHG